MTAARRVILELLDRRTPGATICPSEAARALADDGSDWRRYMDSVHVAVDELLGDDAIAISWKGRRLERRAGPYRIARPVA